MPRSGSIGGSAPLPPRLEMMVCCMSGLVAALGWQAHLLHLGKLVAACACANPHGASGRNARCCLDNPQRNGPSLVHLLLRLPLCVNLLGSAVRRSWTPNEPLQVCCRQKGRGGRGDGGAAVFVRVPPTAAASIKFHRCIASVCAARRPSGRAPAENAVRLPHTQSFSGLFGTSGDCQCLDVMVRN